MTVALDTTTTQIGQIIAGRYRITGILGQGGMGRVYRAEHVTIRRPMALKLLDRRMRRLPELNRRLEREAFALGRASHPNCVTISDCGTLEDGSVYLAMELLDGRTLADELAAHGGRIDIPRALHIARHVLRGLAHAHSVGVVHRDIKPENIFLVDRDGDRDFAKIVDFGIAKLIGDAMDEAGGKDLTQAGLTVGSPVYMSPEQAIGDPLDGRSDLYSLSVVLYEMITGRPPFSSPDKLAVVRMHLCVVAPMFAEIAPALAIPREVEAVIRAGLEKRVADRIASARDYLDRIEPILAGAVARDRQRAAVQPMIPPVRRLGVEVTPGSVVVDAMPRGAEPPPTEQMPVAVRSAAAQAPTQHRQKLTALAVVAGIVVIAAVVGTAGDEPKLGVASARALSSAPSQPEPEPEPVPDPVSEPDPNSDPDSDSNSDPFADLHAALAPTRQPDPASSTVDLSRFDALLRAGHWQSAVELLQFLRARNPADPYLAYRLGHVYCEHMWWNECLDAYGDAIDLDSSYRESESIIRDAISALMSRRQPWRAERFLIDAIGAPAIPQLEWSAQNSRSSSIRERAGGVLRAVRSVE